MLRTSIIISLVTALSAAVACSEGSGAEATETEVEETEEPAETEVEATEDATEMVTEVAETEMVEEPEGPTIVVPVTTAEVELPMRPEPEVPDGGVPSTPLQFNDSSTIEVVDDDGYPDPPALRIEAPFDEYNQVVDLEWPITADLSGGTLVLPMKVVTNEGDPECPKGLQFFVKTGGAYVWGEVGWQNLPEPGGWKEIRFPVDAAQSPADVADQYDPSAVNSIGVAIHTGDCGGDAANRETKPGTAVILLDDIIGEDVDQSNVILPGGSSSTSDGPEGDVLVEVVDTTPDVPTRDVPEVPDGGVPTATLQFNEYATIESTDEDGYPDAPALRIEAPFDNYNEVVELEWAVAEDLSGKVLILPVKVISDEGDPECPKGMQFYVKAGPSYAWGEVGWTNLPEPGGWTEIRFPVDLAESPAGVDFDPSAVGSIGVTIHTGDCGGDAANRDIRPGTVVLLLDDINVVTPE